MSELVFDQDSIVGQWVASRIPHIQTSENLGDFVAIGVVNSDGNEIAGIVYNNYRHTNIELQFASEDPKWATPRTIGLLLSYPFIQLGVPRVTCICNKRNKRIRRFLEGVGFKNEGTIRETLPMPDGKLENAIIYGMIRREAERWLERVNYGKVSTVSAASA